MPTYEYKCHTCGVVFEKRQKFSDEPVTIHEGCGGEVEKLVSPPAFAFKGSGWYVTDYAKKSTSTPSGSKESGGKSEGGSGESSSGSDSSKKSSDGDSSKKSNGGDSKPAATPSAPAATKSE